MSKRYIVTLRGEKDIVTSEDILSSPIIVTETVKESSKPFVLIDCNREDSIFFDKFIFRINSNKTYIPV